MQDTIFKALVMNPVSPDSVDFHNFLVVSGNKIAEVSDDDPRPRFPKAEYADLEARTENRMVIMPGMVDAHLHFAQPPNMGIGGEMDLMDWLVKYTFIAEGKFENPLYARKIIRRTLQMAKASGTTAISGFVTVHEPATNIAFQEADDAGMRLNAGKVMMDRYSPPFLLEKTKDSIEATERLAEKWDGKAEGRLHYVVTPRFAPTSTRELLMQAGRIARERNLRIQTHLSESKREIKRVKRLFKKEPNYTEVYERAGLLGRGSVMAHCIHLSDDEIKSIKSSQTGIVHCPYSNNFLNSGIMPYVRYKRRGLMMGLGTDVSGGYDISVFSQMRGAMEASKWKRFYEGERFVMRATDALFLATLGGARVLALDDRIGNFVPGKEADFVVVADPNPFGRLNFNQQPYEVLLRLCYMASASDVKRAYVQGNLIHQKAQGAS